ncbi:protein transport protein sec20 [Zygosaccharomyces mellis]|uniref:Protein transport protein sec20 n=1 Tax=Zygosaccharomyces mellis TaxID=42258 RepID=A0A4C2E1P3_9SACH|nr:protein transport protein sec20 [Zygosaccharomyces mellis]
MKGNKPDFRYHYNQLPMVLLYEQDLRSLQTDMMHELRMVGWSSTDVEHTKLSEMIIKFESLLKAAVVCLNYEKRFLKLYWTKTIHGMSLQVVNQEPDQYQTVLKEVVQLVNFTDWLTEYKLKLKDFIRKSHHEALAQVDSKRDEAIEQKALEWESQQQPHANDKATATTTKPANTSDQVLSKTRQVSTNLIRGNQILQAGVLQSDLNLDELKQQTSSLSQMNDKYSQLGFVFDKTSQLMKGLEKASHQEKRDVYLSLGFLCLCITWVLWRRIFKLPCKLMLWILFRFFKAILITIGLVRPQNSASVPPIMGTTAISTTSATSGTISPSSPIPKSWNTPSANTESLEHAVDQAMDRIFSHDEL